MFTHPFPLLFLRRVIMGEIPVTFLVVSFNEMGAEVFFTHYHPLWEGAAERVRKILLSQATTHYATRSKNNGAPRAKIFDFIAQCPEKTAKIVIFSI